MKTGPQRVAGVALTEGAHTPEYLTYRDRSPCAGAYVHDVTQIGDSKQLTACYFLVTPFEAFRNRGRNVVLLNHDLEQILR